MKIKFHSNENIKWHIFMNIYLLDEHRLQSSSTYVHACFFHPSTRCQSRCLFLVSLLPVCKILRSFVWCSQRFSPRVEELKCFLFWDCWTGSSSPIKTNRFWLSWSGTMVGCGARTHAHTLSLPVLSLTSLNWREDWLQFESRIQSGLIKFDISLSTSTVSRS